MLSFQVSHRGADAEAAHVGQSTAKRGGRRACSPCRAQPDCRVTQVPERVPSSSTGNTRSLCSTYSHPVHPSASTLPRYPFPGCPPAYPLVSTTGNLSATRRASAPTVPLSNGKPQSVSCPWKSTDSPELSNKKGFTVVCIRARRRARSLNPGSGPGMQSGGYAITAIHSYARSIKASVGRPA